MFSTLTGSTKGSNAATIFNQDLSYTSLETKITATQSGDIQCDSLTTTGSISSGTSVNVGSNLVVTGTMQGQSLTDSSSTSTGAMIIEGGVGIKKALHAKSVTSTDTVTVPQITTATDDLTLAPAVKTTTAKPVTITDTTESSSQSTGALTVTGGVGVGGNVRANFFRSATSVLATSKMTTPEVEASSGNLTLTAPGDLVMNPTGKTSTSKKVEITDASLSAVNSATGGALTVTGGISVGSPSYIQLCRGHWFEAFGRMRTPLIDNCLNINAPNANIGVTNMDISINAAPTKKVNITGGPLDLQDTSASTSTTTGALRVAGGVGIAGAVNIGGNVNITGTLTASNISGGGGGGSGDVVTATTKVVTPLIESSSGDVTLTPAVKVTSTKPVSITDTTTSSSSTTGALTVTGGVGVADNVNVGGSLSASTKVRTPLLDTASGDLTLTPAGNVSITKGMSVTSTTDSTNLTSGAVQVAGGMAVTKNLYVGSLLNVPAISGITYTYTTVNFGSHPNTWTHAFYFQRIGSFVYWHFLGGSKFHVGTFPAGAQSQSPIPSQFRPQLGAAVELNYWLQGADNAVRFSQLAFQANGNVTLRYAFNVTNQQFVSFDAGGGTTLTVSGAGGCYIAADAFPQSMTDPIEFSVPDVPKTKRRKTK